MLNPDTAPKNLSIWSRIDRTEFERQAGQLQDRVISQGSSRSPEHLQCDRSYPFSFDLERQVADDFAYIAAHDYGGHFVSAVTIDLNEGQESLSIRLAVNGGVKGKVGQAFNELTQILKMCAKKEISRQTCEDQAFDLILKLNRNKILGRLHSSRFKRSNLPYKYKDRLPLPTRLRQLFQRYLATSHRTLTDPDLANLNAEITSFESAFAQLEKANTKFIDSAIKEVVNRTYVLTTDGIKFLDRLSRLGLPESMLHVRELSEVNKIANYRRICTSLANFARSYRNIVTNIQWSPLMKYSPSVGSKVHERQYVHAEIQLIVYYELQNPLLWPRVIGSSKHACFLCDSFIRTHGRFYIAGAHRQMYPHWTVPDLKEYSWQTRNKFRRILAQVFEEVKNELGKMREGNPSQQAPLQSSINLHLASLPTPSISTLRSDEIGEASSKANTVNRGNYSSITSPTQIEGFPQQTPDFSHQDNPKKTGDPSNRSYHLLATNLESRLPQDHGSFESPQDKNISNRAMSEHGELQQEERDIHTTCDVSKLSLCKWLHLYASFVLDKPNAGQSTSQSQNFTGGSVYLESPSIDDNYLPVIDLDDLSHEKDLVLARTPIDTVNELCFILRREQHHAVRVRCHWEK